MLRRRAAEERGQGQHGWLDTRHTFSFDAYYDPEHMGFGVLRVINEDRVQPGKGFGTHSHRDMEILSYVLEGALAHRDSLGNVSVLRAGEFQCMTAGTGINHSEFNPSDAQLVHFYQIWIIPERRGLPSSYAQRAFADAQRPGQLRLVASPDGRDGSLIIHQDAEVFLGALEPGQEIARAWRTDRRGWLQVLRGAVQVNGLALGTGDGVAISDERSLMVRAAEPAEFMVFDLP